MLPAGLRLHFIGIGGIGMSALAQVCLSRGFSVCGCDIALNGTSFRLRQCGVPVEVGHSPQHLDGQVDLVVYSAAVRCDEPELISARSRGIPTISRGEFLAELTSDKQLITVAGAHGKTTTSAMAAELLRRCGWDPTVVIGGLMRSTGANAQFGKGAYFVAESDESDGSFLRLSPQVAIVTNLDREHLNHYGSLERLVAAFRMFVEQITPGGTLIRCADDPLVRCHVSHPTQLSYGLSSGAEVTAYDISTRCHESRFRVAYNDQSLGQFSLRMPGCHNVVNALAVVSLGLTLDIPIVTVRETLAEFQGTERRFQVFRLPGDIWLVEDYAHHPAEIQATLAAETMNQRRRIAVFQPHRFSRTHLLEQEFAASFDRADGVIITDIYPAFESPIPGVSGARLAELIKARGHPCVRYVPREKLHTFIECIARAGDTVFFLGAGDIGKMCHEVAARFHSTERAACKAY